MYTLLQNVPLLETFKCEKIQCVSESLGELVKHSDPQDPHKTYWLKIWPVGALLRHCQSFLCSEGSLLLYQLLLLKQIVTNLAASINTSLLSHSSQFRIKYESHTVKIKVSARLSSFLECLGTVCFLFICVVGRTNSLQWSDRVSHFLAGYKLRSIPSF